MNDASFLFLGIKMSFLWEKNHNRMLHSLALIAKDQEHSLRDFIRDTKAGSRAQYHKF